MMRVIVSVWTATTLMCVTSALAQSFPRNGTLGNDTTSSLISGTGTISISSLANSEASRSRATLTPALSSTTEVVASAILATLNSTTDTAWNTSFAFPKIASIRNGTSNSSLDTAQTCDAQWASYTSASRAYEPSKFTTSVTTEFWNYTDASTSYTWECETACGTICYARSKTAVNTVILETHIGSSIRTVTAHESFSTPKPTCSVGLTDCQALWSSYSSVDSAWSDATSTITAPPAFSTASPAEPECSTCAAGRCTIDPQYVEVYYFPVTANVSRDMCASNPTGGIATRFPEFPNSTYVPITTGDYTTLDEKTLYAGNVYISVGVASAHNPCGSAVGLTHSGSWLTLASSEIQSMRGYPKNNIPYSFNFADFNWPVPYSAYYGQPECNIRIPACTVVYQDEYNPQLVMPAAIRGLDPAWASCSLGFFGLADPPHSLKTLQQPLFSSTINPPSPPTDVPADPTPPVNDPNPPSDPAPGDPPASQPSPTNLPDDPNGDPPGNEDPGNSPPENDPPENDPPSNDPPANNPPANNPPANNPPANNPPANNPPANNPPANNPPASNPPANNPPANNPPASNPPANDPPANDPPANDPPANNPPASNPAANNPAANNPAANNPAANNPPANSPPGTNPINNNPRPAPVTIPIGSTSLVADPTTGLVVAPGTTLHNGDPAITFSGTTISLAPTGVVITDPSGTQNVAFPIITPAPSQQVAVTLSNGQVVTAISSNGQVVIGGVTLNSQVSVTTLPGGQVVSLGPSGGVVVGGSTIFPTITAAPGQQVVLTLDNGQVVTAISSNGQIVIGSVTIDPSHPFATLSNGEILSLGSSGVVLGGSTTVFPPTITSASTQQAVLTLRNGQIVTATSSNGQVVIGTVTLDAAHPIATLSNGEIVSLGSSGVVLGGSTTVFPPTITSASTQQAVLTLRNGQIVTAMSSNGQVVIGTVTLDAAHPIATLSNGQIVSLGPSGLVLGASTTGSFDATKFTATGGSITGSTASFSDVSSSRTGVNGVVETGAGSTGAAGVMEVRWGLFGIAVVSALWVGVW